jgi:hypothetical protein
LCSEVYSRFVGIFFVARSMMPKGWCLYRRIYYGGTNCVAYVCMADKVCKNFVRVERGSGGVGGTCNGDIGVKFILIIAGAWYVRVSIWCSYDIWRRTHGNPSDV